MIRLEGWWWEGWEYESDITCNTLNPDLISVQSGAVIKQTHTRLTSCQSMTTHSQDIKPGKSWLLQFLKISFSSLFLVPTNLQPNWPKTYCFNCSKSETISWDNYVAPEKLNSKCQNHQLSTTHNFDRHHFSPQKTSVFSHYKRLQAQTIIPQTPLQYFCWMWSNGAECELNQSFQLIILFW